MNKIKWGNPKADVIWKKISRLNDELNKTSPYDRRYSDILDDILKLSEQMEKVLNDD